MAKSRFAGIFSGPEPAGVETIPVFDPPPPAPAAEPAAAAPAPVLRAGKRSNPAYRQISTYVRHDLYKQVRKELTDQERDFSDLLDELLEQWIATRKAG